MFENDPVRNVLYIDLSDKNFRVEERRDLFERYIGGAGVAIQLLHEECPEGCDALAPENPIIFAVGPLTGLFPLASKTVAMFKSPHTGNLGESHCGGRSAVAIRMAGYGAIVIKGRSDSPIYIAIHGNRVYFRDASSLWGMEGNITAGRIIREHEPGAGLRTIMRIGRAGEKLVSYACVTTETYRHFGRLGLGAVFGSKKLKAVMISGKRTLAVRDSKKFRQVYDEIYQAAVASLVMKKYHDLGTAENILPLNKFGGLPTRNLKEARFEGAPGISGETFAEEYLGRRLACSHCPVGCIHIAALREPYYDEPYFYKTSMICYDYEPIYALGSMLGGSDADGFLKLMDQIEIWGMDVMSAGVILAWATEAQRSGIISDTETMGIKLEWGDYAAYIDAVRLIIEQPNEFYKALARGVLHAASIYGGEDYALAFGGNEMPGYHTGPGAHIGVLIGARHSHLDNAGYSVDQKFLSEKQISPAELVGTLLAEERWRQTLSSLVICFFARGIYQPDTICKSLHSAGFDLTPEDLYRIGEEIHREKYRFKIREGFSLENLRLPGRIFETHSPVGKLDEEFIRRAIRICQEEVAL
ncbi:MAG: aldehyde:ferredoxin oxidoreductase [Candidatus Methanogaster sp.]|uniref:Aldehyde:ferredoxin oxidoreductase n=1 Tax=Candidatus Methanogaster sp. TaxID=3386292 RepID=A0AC61L638_9EURY|nr:MAG: aldehyde:ferredoxin oxidoreductase [ANME-2 cluster archaeon]